MSSPPVGTTTTVGLSSVDLASMDIETALMAVQTQRANLLESQLKDQMEAVRKRNVQIEALNNILAKVRDLRPDTTDGTANTSSGGNVNVPVATTGTVGVDATQISELENEVTQLQEWLDAKGSGGTGGGATGTTGTTGTTGGGSTTTTGGSTRITVPSNVKVEPATANTDARAPYAKVINELVDINAQPENQRDYGSLVSGNRNVIDGFVAYYEQNKGLFPAPVPAGMSLGFNAESDEGDITDAFEDPNVRAAFEVYVRLAYQGGGSPAKPNTAINAPVPNTGSGGSTGGGSTGSTGTGGSTGGSGTGSSTIGNLGPDSSSADLQAAIDLRNSKIAALNAAGNQVVTADSVTSMSLNQALQHYGFKTGDMNQGEFDQLINNITSRIDSLNSSQQLDMLRLQSLTNKRNESFDIMTNFIKKLQDNRSSIIGNMR